MLRREKVIVLPDGCADETIKAAQDIIRKATRPDPRAAARVDAAWVVVGEFEGASDTKAIERHAGKQGTPDAKPGVYKAPPTRSWKGGEVYEKPPEPKVERKRLED